MAKAHRVQRPKPAAHHAKPTISRCSHHPKTHKTKIAANKATHLHRVRWARIHWSSTYRMRWAKRIKWSLPCTHAPPFHCTRNKTFSWCVNTRSSFGCTIDMRRMRNMPVTLWASAGICSISCLWQIFFVWLSRFHRSHRGRISMRREKNFSGSVRARAIWRKKSSRRWNKS